MIVVYVAARSIGMVLIVKLMLVTAIITAWNVQALTHVIVHNAFFMLILILMDCVFAVITILDMPALCI